jgi:hypothetical protein
MSRWIDVLGVSAALAASLLYVLAALGPKGLRARLWRALGLVLARAPRPLRSARLEARIAASAARMQAACGGCDTCGSASAAEATTGSAAGATPGFGAGATPGPTTRGGEVRVPVGRIGRRQPQRPAER